MRSGLIIKLYGYLTLLVLAGFTHSSPALQLEPALQAMPADSEAIYSWPCIPSGSAAQSQWPMVAGDATAVGETPSDTEPGGQSASPAATAVPGQKQNFVDITHASFSSKLEAMVRQIDGFFATDRAFDEATGSYLRLLTELSVDEGEKAELFGDIKAKIELPATERRLKLLIESDPESETLDDVSDIPAGDAEKDSYYLSIEHRRKRTGKWDIRPSLGIKARRPPDPFARLRAIRYFEMRDWLLRVSGNIFWFNSEGAGMNTTLEFDHPLNETLLFRSATTLGWKHDEKLAEAHQRFSLYQRLDEHNRILYQMGLNADDAEQWQVTDYFLRLAYRSRIYNKWLFFEIQPQLLFDREDDFASTSSLLLRLEALFGQQYL